MDKQTKRGDGIHSYVRDRAHMQTSPGQRGLYMETIQAISYVPEQSRDSGLLEISFKIQHLTYIGDKFQDPIFQIHSWS